MTAYGNQSAAFRVRHEDGIVRWIGFEFENVKGQDIPNILLMAKLAQECHELPMYMCSNQRSGRLIRLTDEADMRHFIKTKFLR